MVRSFTAGRSETNLPPHYMFRRGATGFAGKHFLETGLELAVNAARIRIAELLETSLKRLPPPTVRKLGQFRGAGINLSVAENVSELSKINVQRAITKAFTEVIPVAKKQADSAFNRSVDSHDKPLSGPKGASTISSYKFEVIRDGNSVVIRPTGRGGKKGVAKVRALNFGLRTSFTDYQEENEDTED